MYRVLVVDDEKIEREGIKFLLSREEGEFEISEASNGRQALEILRNEEIDILWPGTGKEGKREKRGAADRDL